MNIEILYHDWLLKLTPYQYSVCQECGWGYSHPINYCVKCPGRTKQERVTNAQWIKFVLQSYNVWSYRIEEFLAEHGDIPNQEYYIYPNRGYYELGNVARSLLGKPTVPLD